MGVDIPTYYSPLINSVKGFKKLSLTERNAIHLRCYKIKRKKRAMTLTNQNLIMLSKFASKAKKHIGLVKAVEMFNDEQYASDVLSQAMLSENPELVDLTKKNKF